MTTVTEQYAEYARQGQEAFDKAVGQGQEVFNQAVDGWTRLASNPTAWLSVPTAPYVHQALDSAFDYAATLLDIQRNVAKQLTAASVSAVENAAKQVSDAANQVAPEAAPQTDQV